MFLTDINHRRKNRKPVNQRHGDRHNYHNGYAHPDCKTNDSDVCRQRVGKTDYLDKSLHAWGRKSLLADKTPFAYIGNDFCNGHRGMAKSVRGAKKFVRSRIRFHENAATKKMAYIDEE